MYLGVRRDFDVVFYRFWTKFGWLSEVLYSHDYILEAIGSLKMDLDREALLLLLPQGNVMVCILNGGCRALLRCSFTNSSAATSLTFAAILLYCHHSK